MDSRRRVGPLVRPAPAGGGGRPLGSETRPRPSWLGSGGPAHHLVVGRGHGGPVDGVPAGGLGGGLGAAARGGRRGGCGVRVWWGGGRWGGGGGAGGGAGGGGGGGGGRGGLGAPPPRARARG